MKSSMAILATPLDNPKILEVPLYYEKFVAYISPDDPIYGKQELTPSDMPTENLWVLEEGHCLRNQVLNFCDHNVHTSTIEAGSIDTLVKIVDINCGYTIIPELHIDFLTEEQKKNLRPIVRPEATREISMIIRHDYVREGLMNAVADSIKQIIPAHMSRFGKTGYIAGGIYVRFRSLHLIINADAFSVALHIQILQSEIFQIRNPADITQNFVPLNSEQLPIVRIKNRIFFYFLYSCFESDNNASPGIFLPQNRTNFIIGIQKNFIVLLEDNDLRPQRVVDMSQFYIDGARPDHHYPVGYFGTVEHCVIRTYRGTVYSGNMSRCDQYSLENMLCDPEAESCCLLSDFIMIVFLFD